MSSHTGSDVEALALRGKQAPTALFCSNDLLATPVGSHRPAVGASGRAARRCGHTGDLTDLGRPHEYAQLRAQLQALEMPYFLLPGNHDDRAGLRVPDHAYRKASPFIQYSVDTYPLRLLALDTVVPMKSHGELWRAPGLAGATAGAAPPAHAGADAPSAVLTGIEHMDAIGLLAGAPELERIVSRHPNVERVLCGHLHRTIFQRFGGTIASTCPGTAHQLALELGPRPTCNTSWNRRATNCTGGTTAGWSRTTR